MPTGLAGGTIFETALPNTLGNTVMIGFRTGLAVLMVIGLGAAPAAAQSVATDGFTGGVGGNNVTVTRNIDASSNVSVTHDVSVSHSINGQSMGAGLSAPEVLGIIKDRSSWAAGYSGEHQAVATGLAAQVLGLVGLPNY